MKSGFYPKLAWDGIRKNKRLYLPYILTCIGMVMMHYIIIFLVDCPTVKAMAGGETIASMLGLGCWVIGFFALLFLFYSNSFLIRRRKKEFGLYNILGMGKWNISRILFWESLIIAALALGVGMGLGIALSKLFELLLVNIVSMNVSYDFSVSAQSIVQTLLVFGAIFGLVFLNALRQVSLSNPVELLRSENLGEKPPKAKWLLTLLGLVILAGAYYLAVTIEDPVTALGFFFIAVIMVICATYLLFIASSVTICRILQKKKNYYYKANHFVSVSSMAYRMKRNGTGLASICILLTMVLVMLSSTTALFAGSEDSLHSRYPRDINLDFTVNKLEGVDEEAIAPCRENILSFLKKQDALPENVYDYRMGYTAGYLDGGEFEYNIEDVYLVNMPSDQTPMLLYLIPLSDYNAMMGTHQTLEKDEVLIYPYRTEYTAPTFRLSEGPEYKVKEVVDDWISNGNSAMTVIPTLFVFVPDLEAAVAPWQSLASFSGDPLIEYCWYYGFDLDMTAAEKIDLYQQLRDTDWVDTPTELTDSMRLECLEAERTNYYSLFGGLFFIGIMLSLVFLAAAVLIIYYKQISEGYEDQARFEIMQKVGMTKRDIRKSINSQMLTVFFLPLLTAGIHLCFAFPIIHKLLLMFNLWNTHLLIATTVGAFLVFGIFYTLVYRLTSNAYYSIVSGAKKD